MIKRTHTTPRNSDILRHLALAFVLSGGAAHAQYSSIYFFGDSLTDSGSYTSLVTASGAPTANKFTNNPGTVWAENLGARYGLNVIPGFTLDLLSAQFTATGGNNYAIGGARITQFPGVFSLPANPALGDAIAGNIVPTAGQIDTHLAQTGGGASSNALYAYWGGANDVFFQAGAVGLGLPVDVAAANMVSAANDAAAQINRLRAAGARNVAVIAAPDIGTTPFAATAPAGTAQLLTALSDAYNTTLQQGLAAAGTNGIAYFDPRPVFADIIARPAVYGVSNTAIPACGAAPSLGCGPAQQLPGSANFLFADGVHPTALVHGVLSDWVYSSLSAPGQLSALARIPVGRLGAQWRTVDNRVREFATDSGARGFYASGDYAPTRVDATATSPSLKGEGKTLGIGFDRAFSNAMLGISLGYGDHSYDLGGAGGNIGYSELILSAYGALRFGAAYVDATLSYADLDFDVSRAVALGPFLTVNNGSTSGHQTGIKLGGGYHFNWNSMVHGPIVTLSWERVSVDGYSESANPTAMSFGGQESTSLRHRIGWQAVGKAPTEWGDLRPYVRLTHEREYKENRRSITAGFVGSPFTFSTPTSGAKESWGLLAAGVSLEQKQFNVSVGVTTTFARSSVTERAVHVIFGVPLR
jgi:outer membrane lipase/esterase